MKKQLALVIVGLVVVLVASAQLARALAGPSPNDIQDSLPAWSSDASRIAFERTAPNLQHVVTMKPSGKDLFVATFSGLFRGFVPGAAAPPYMLVQQDDNTILTIGGRFSGPAAEVHGVDATASPDGTRLAYLRGGTLYVADLTAIKIGAFPIPVPPERAVAIVGAPGVDDVLGPVWSPSGERIAFASATGLVVAAADGSSSNVVVPGEVANPSWTRDSTGIAYQTKTGGFDSIFEVAWFGSRPVELVGGDQDARFPQFSPTTDALAWISDRQHVRGGATPYQFALYVRAGGGDGQKLVDDVHPGSPPRWSPASDQLVVAAGQECRRWGVYVVHSYGGTPHRLSNLCRFDGTAQADTITGSPYFDLINGNGGNDVIHGLGGNDKISGENGNDTISGGTGNDFILAGPGNDVISGGSGNDTIIPGNGRDRIDCGPGNDTVEGAGPLDRISKNCEHVGR